MAIQKIIYREGNIEQDKKYFEIAKARINDVIIRKVGGNIEITDTKINKISIEYFL